MRLIIFLLILRYAALPAQINTSLDADDSTALNTIAIYPQALRQSIFESCQYPELLLKTENLQKKTSRKFRDLLNDYFKNEQEKFWNLSRQPGLIAKIVEGGHKSKEELESIALAYPAEIRETIVSYGSRFYVDLEEMHKLQKKTESEFNTLLKPYPESTQRAMSELISHPEVIGVLSENMRVTVTVGDLYKTNKERLNIMMDSLSAVNADLKAKEFEAWKKGLEDQPEVSRQMYDAAKEFSKEQGNTPTESTTENITINYVVDPYPYWFGYPWWYSYPYWYPYPYWYHWGFYHGPHGFVYIGLPSPFFTHWYFSHHHHHYYYNYFSDYCISHYYGHRTSHGGFNKEVRTWTKVNESQLPRGFLNNDGKRAERLKQIGGTTPVKAKPIEKGRPTYSKEDYRIPKSRPKEQAYPPKPDKQPKAPVIKDRGKNPSSVPNKPQGGTKPRKR